MSVSEAYAKLVIKSEAQKFILSEVYVPDFYDTDNEFMEEPAIERLAHSFLMNGRVDKIDLEHNRTPSGCLVCESYIVRHENDPYGFKRGSWVLGVKVNDESLWQKVLKGDINGFSWSGPSIIIPRSREVDYPIGLEGTTEPFPILHSEDTPHFHNVSIKYNDSGIVIPTLTEPVNGHFHQIIKTTATLPANGHSHRIIIQE